MYDNVDEILAICDRIEQLAAKSEKLCAEILAGLSAQADAKPSSEVTT